MNASERIQVAAPMGPKSSLLLILQNLPSYDAAKVMRSLFLLGEFWPEIAKPYVEPILATDNLWQLRIQGAKKHYRLLFRPNETLIQILQIVSKKTETIHKKELETASERRLDPTFSLGDTLKFLEKNAKFKDAWLESEAEFHVARTILRLRNELSLSQRQLSERTNVPTSVIARLEGGQYLPPLSTLYQIVRKAGGTLSLNIEAS